MPRYYLLLPTVAAVLLADGYLSGRVSGRWSASQAVAAERIQDLSLTIGEWQGESQQLPPQMVERAGFSGYVLRRYINKRTGANVGLLLACGRPGPLSVHTPEICYRGAGFTAGSESGRCSPSRPASANPAEFFEATFDRKDAANPEKLWVLWAWNKNGAWQCSDCPRWTFAGTPVLYKLYVTQQYFPGEDTAEAKTCLEFLQDALPEVDRVLAPGP